MDNGPADPTSMSMDAVDYVFRGLDKAVTWLAAAPAADHEVADVPEAADEPGVDDGSYEPRRGPRTLGWPDPWRALTQARRQLASEQRRRRA